DLVVGPDMICRKVFPSQIEIKEAVAAVVLSIGRGQQFDLVLEFAFEGIPPRPACAQLNAERAADLRCPKINPDFRVLAFVPAQGRTRRGATGIWRPDD